MEQRLYAEAAKLITQRIALGELEPDAQAIWVEYQRVLAALSQMFPFAFEKAAEK